MLSVLDQHLEKLRLIYIYKSDNIVFWIQRHYSSTLHNSKQNVNGKGTKNWFVEWNSETETWVLNESSFCHILDKWKCQGWQDTGESPAQNPPSSSPQLAPCDFWVFEILTYLLTPWCRVLFEKLTGLQLVREFPAFHGTRRFITALTSIRHLSLSWASPIQSRYPHPTSWSSILILSTHLRLGLPIGLRPSGFPTKNLYTPISSPIRATCPAHLILLDFITRTILGEEYKSFSSSLCNLLHSPVTLSLLGPNILLNTILLHYPHLLKSYTQSWKT